MRSPRRSLILVAGLLAGGTAHAEDWTGFHPGRLSSERSGATFSAGWQHEMPAERQAIYRALIASPVAAEGVVVVGNYGDRVRALDESSGKPLWDATIAGPRHAAPATWRGWLFVPSVDLTLRALRLADGSEVWTKELPGMGYSSPAVAGDRLYVATADPAARLLCLDAETGNTLWQTGAEQLQQGAHAAVVVAGERVLVTESQGRLHSFSRADGAWQWTAVAPGLVNLAAPVVLGSRVFLLPGGDTARLHAFELETGAVAAGFPVTLTPPAPTAGTLLGQEHVVSSLAGAAGLLVFGWRVDERFDTNADGTPDRFVSREQLVALSETGAPLWTAPAGRLETNDGNRVPLHAFTATPALFPGEGGTLVAATSSLEARVRVYDSAGAALWTAALAGPTRSSPVFANGRLVVATDGGIVRSFASTSNRRRSRRCWAFRPPRARSTPAAVTIKWGTAVDREMQPVEYEVRVDDDGEVLHDWQVGQAHGGRRAGAGDACRAGRTPSPCAPAIRQGAWSAWSAPQTFQRRRAARPSTVDGQPVSRPRRPRWPARARAPPLRSAPGRLALTATVAAARRRDPARGGPAPHGAAGRGWPVAVELARAAQLAQLTVADARVGVLVEARRRCACAT